MIYLKNYDIYFFFEILYIYIIRLRRIPLTIYLVDGNTFKTLNTLFKMHIPLISRHSPMSLDLRLKENTITVIKPKPFYILHSHYNSN